MWSLQPICSLGFITNCYKCLRGVFIDAISTIFDMPIIVRLAAFIDCSNISMYYFPFISDLLHHTFITAISSLDL